MKATPAALLVLAAALGAGCATPMPAEEIGAARASIASAAPAAASPELERARQKLALAERWQAAKDHGPARWLAEQAQVDAELAAARHAAEIALGTLARHEQDAGFRRISLTPR